MRFDPYISWYRNCSPRSRGVSSHTTPRRLRMRRFELQVPGNVDDDNALITADKKEQLEQLSTLVVKRSLPPVLDYELGNQDGDLASRTFAFKLQDVVDQWHQHEAVGRSENNKLRNGPPGIVQG